MKKVSSLLLVILMTITFTNLFGQCINCNQSTQNGDYSSAIGTNANSDGYASFASGSYVNATGTISTALGSYSNANGDRSFCFGTNVEANATKSFVIGAGYSDTYPLVNNDFDTYTFMVGLNSDKPTFFVGTSEGVNKTGRIGIGNMTDPLAKLHIYSDEAESATLFLQPSNWTTEMNAELWLGDMNHGISAEVDAGMVYNTENYHVFKGGDVFIEDIDKGIIMKSPDGNCWRGVLDNSGNLQFTVLDNCPEVIVDLPEKTDVKTNANLKVYPNPTNDYLTVELTDSNQKAGAVSLLDEKGSVLITKQFRSLTTKLYTGDLPAGIYFVRVNAGQKEMVQKVIKK